MTDRHGTVFIVDDDLPVRRALGRLLKSVGYDVVTFGSASEFLAYPGWEHPACLVLDVRMPGQSGFELFDALKARDQELPVIFITGHGDIPMAVRAMKAGAADFLSKPFDEGALLDAVRQALSRDRRPCPDGAA